MNEQRPKIGIALSGASGRAIAHIGVLEVLKENNIPLDIIVGCSSGALIGASFAIGTMENMKKFMFVLTFPKMLRMWSTRNAKGGLFHLDNPLVETELNTVTKDLKFEDIKNVQLGFVATDINTGELVTLNSGKLNKAFKASVAVPGFFGPAVIDKRILVDGGLVNIVPTKIVKEMGADIVLGVNIAASKFIYEKRLPIWRGYRFITRLLGLQFIREKLLPILSPKIFFRIDSQSDVLEEEDVKIPGMFTILSKALDHSLAISDQWKESDMACDWMIEPRVKHYGKTEFNSLQHIYEEGRRAASLAIPHIRQLIENYQKNQARKVSQQVEKHDYQTS